MKGERGIWQRRYWEHTLRDEVDWQHHMNYIYYYPVKHGHVERVADWPYSTFHRYVKAVFTPRIGVEVTTKEMVDLVNVNDEAEEMMGCAMLHPSYNLRG